MGSPAEAEQVRIRIAERLGAKSLAELCAIPAERIIELQGQGASSVPMALPSADGYYLPLDTYTAAATGQDNKVDLLTGWASNEGAIFSQLWGRTTAVGWRGFAESFAPGRAVEFLSVYPASDDAEAKASAATFKQTSRCWLNCTIGQKHLNGGRIVGTGALSPKGTRTRKAEVGL